MEDITKNQIIDILKEDNKKLSYSDIVVYASAFFEYVQSQNNIDKNGVIVFHPRTSEPIENPFLKIRASSIAQLNKMKNIKSERLWQMYA